MNPRTTLTATLPGQTSSLVKAKTHGTAWSKQSQFSQVKLLRGLDEKESYGSERLDQSGRVWTRAASRLRGRQQLPPQQTIR